MAYRKLPQTKKKKEKKLRSIIIKCVLNDQRLYGKFLKINLPIQRILQLIKLLSYDKIFFDMITIFLPFCVYFVISTCAIQLDILKCSSNSSQQLWQITFFCSLGEYFVQIWTCLFPFILTSSKETQRKRKKIVLEKPLNYN